MRQNWLGSMTKRTRALYDAYRTDKRFAPRGEQEWDAGKGNTQTPNRYGTPQPFRGTISGLKISTP